MTEILTNELKRIENLDIEQRVQEINELKLELKNISPFAVEPVDCVQWVKEELVIANDYNPNSVAPPPKWSCCTPQFKKMDIPNLS